MGNLFNVDNAFFTFLGKVCDIMLISTLWLLLCIPIVTIGPATTALYYVVVKVIRRERGYLFREFFRSFKLNFKRGALVSILLTVCYIVLYVDLYATWNTATGESNVPSIFLGIYIAITLVLTCFTIYVFPILSRFDMTVKQLIKTAIYMSMRHLPFSIVMLAVIVAGVIGVLYIFPLIFILPGTVTFINSLLMERIFKKYMPKVENAEEETGKDLWYLE